MVLPLPLVDEDRAPRARLKTPEAATACRIPTTAAVEFFDDDCLVPPPEKRGLLEQGPACVLQEASMCSCLRRGRLGRGRGPEARDVKREN